MHMVVYKIATVAAAEIEFPFMPMMHYYIQTNDKTLTLKAHRATAYILEDNRPLKLTRVTALGF